MYILIVVFICILLTVWLLVIFKDKIHFYITGLDSKFHFSEITLLWKLSKTCSLENPSALYVSVPSLDKCIEHVVSEAKEDNEENSPKVQDFLTRLYKYRTKIVIEQEKKRGLDSTRYLDSGQRLRIILRGNGVFTSRILNNAREMTISIPTQKNLISVPSDEWIGKTISVYLWRKGDANYVFDTRVSGSGVFQGETVLYLEHTDKLLRAQKRKSVRCNCNIYAQLYPITQDVTDFNMVETQPGYRCLLEDISEDGALVRVGGKGQPNVQIKLQFELGNQMVLMYGVVRAVEYNKTINQSRLHFECLHLSPTMRNAILSYVYNILPPDQKEIFNALSATEADAEQGENGADTDSAEITGVPPESAGSVPLSGPVESLPQNEILQPLNGGEASEKDNKSDGDKPDAADIKPAEKEGEKK